MVHTVQQPAHILIVDDEPKVVRLLREVLHATGYRVSSTGSGAEAIEKVALEQPDLVILDIMLTGVADGYEVARRVREFSEVPIIMLTAKARESDLLRGFDVGTDDYLTKPFSTKELLVRVRALLKRSQQGPANTLHEPLIECGPLQINLARRRVTVLGEEVHLTRTEYNLLHQLAAHRNQILLHEDLLAAVWGPEYRDDVDYLRTFVRQLRRKLEPDPAHPQLILTSQGVGYTLVCPEE